MLIKPNMFSGCAFGKKQQIGFDTGVGVKHAIRQPNDGVEITLIQQFFFKAGLHALAK